MPATLTTTGGGKSFFLDELAALRKEDLDMIFGDLEEMKKILKTMRKGNEVVPVLAEIMKQIREILENTVSLHRAEHKFCLNVNMLQLPLHITVDLIGQL